MEEGQLKNIFSRTSKRFKLSEHKESLLYTLINIFASYFILVITIIIKYGDTQIFDFSPAIHTGEVFLICASMGAASMYSLHIAKRDSKIGWITFLFILTFFNYAMSLGFYFNLSKIGNTAANINFKTLTVLIVFFINMITVYFSHFYQNISTNVPAERSAQIDDLRQAFKKII